MTINLLLIDTICILCSQRIADRVLVSASGSECIHRVFLSGAGVLCQPHVNLDVLLSGSRYILGWLILLGVC